MHHRELRSAAPNRESDRSAKPPRAVQPATRSGSWAAAPPRHKESSPGTVSVGEVSARWSPPLVRRRITSPVPIRRRTTRSASMATSVGDTCGPTVSSARRRNLATVIGPGTRRIVEHVHREVEIVLQCLPVGVETQAAGNTPPEEHRRRRRQRSVSRNRRMPTRATRAA